VPIAVATGACTSGAVSATQGIGQPIVVESAQFISGALPGPPPPDASTASDAGLGSDARPIVTDISVANAVISQGEQGLAVTGHASTGAQTVGVRFEDLGTGYWVVPLGAPDPSDDNLLTWQLTADFAKGLPPGFHNLVFSAIGAAGGAGTESGLPVCVDTPVPDNLNICAPSRPPPPAVLSLSWDNPVDLQLTVRSPSGAILGAGIQTTTPDGGAVGSAVVDAGSGPVLDRESNANCVIDDIDRDDLVWQSPPEAGTYQVWVDLFRACGQAAVTFTVTLWLPETEPDGNQRLVEQSPPVAKGELTALQANGGATAGLFVGSFVIN
jgi:hypothetical protein